MTQTSRSFVSETASAYTTGYSFTGPARTLLRELWLKPNVVLSVLTAVSLHASIVGIALGSSWIQQRWHGLGILTYPLALLIIARQLRGLENLVHEGAHYNWTRQRQLNDALVNLLAALPVLARVSEFREAHDIHHRQTGSIDDPCRQRYVVDLDLASLDRTSAKRYFVGTLTRIVKYAAGWWVGPSGISSASLVWGVSWHAVGVVLPVASVFGASQAIVLWVLYFAVPFLFVLPTLRFHAEVAKHDYVNNDGTVFGATFSNVGYIHVLLHPCGDQFHLLHHLHPAIPHHRLKQADRWLVVNDPKYSGARRRHSILETPQIRQRIGG